MPQPHLYSLCTWYRSHPLTGQIQSGQNTQGTAHFFPLQAHFKSIMKRSQGSCNTWTSLVGPGPRASPRLHLCHWSKVSNQGRGKPQLTGSPRGSRDLTTSTKTTDFKHQDSATDQETEGAESGHRSVRPWHQQWFSSHGIESDCVKRYHMAEGSFTANQRLRREGSEVPSCSSFPTSAGHAEEL